MPRTWIPITAERFGEMLDILPPLDFTGDRFLVGEAVSHTSEGIPTFTAFARVGDGYFESATALTRRQFHGTSSADILAAAAPT